MFTTPFKVNLRWSDLDPNFHLKHIVRNSFREFNSIEWKYCEV